MTTNPITADTITDDQIRALADGCFERNDGALRMLCTIALEGLDGAIVGDREYTAGEARQACADAINARAQEKV